ncbi:MAG: hypothetical protein Q8K79_07210 [Solirubrobacteraceae bacterium]|nr:hypothetical protein [Solirubrobacteraceae bacterium]
MSAGARVTSFGALLVAIFALAVLAGRALDPATDAAGSEDHAAPGGAGAHAAGAAPATAGGGLRLVAEPTTTFDPGRAARLTLRVVDAHGDTLRDFEVEQSRRMHLIVVRRDLRRFQHLHPAQDRSGAWTTALTLPDAGVYHAFADFQTGGERHTLGVDLFAGGQFTPLPLPAPSNVAATDGYDVSLRDDGSRLRFAVGRNGRLRTDLQPYLGARGHLVVLRAGDLAYEHVHPVNRDELTFATDELRPGRYRLFLQFRHADRVHTAAFTKVVAP